MSQTFSEEEYLPISSLNDLLFCERRAALHLIEGIWRDNQYTIEGSFAHRNVDVEANRKRGDQRNFTGMWVVSYRLGIIGKCDLVELRATQADKIDREADRIKREADRMSAIPGPRASRPQSTEPSAFLPPSPEPSASRLSSSKPSPTPPSSLPDPTQSNLNCNPTPCSAFDDQPISSPFPFTPYPVDFKRGKKRRWDNNEVQLCAQALCLEEMLGVTVPKGAIFHVKSGRREEVEFTPDLRRKTETTVQQLRSLLNAKITPKAKFAPKCKGCSLLEWCLPKSLRPRATATAYLNSLLHSCPTSGES